MSGSNFGQTPSKAEIGIESESVELQQGTTFTMPSVVVNTLGNLIPIKIRNTGISKLTIYSIRLSGGNSGEYSLDLSGFTNTIEPNSSSDFYIRFRPLSVGFKQTLIVIQSNDANESVYKFNIHSQSQVTPNPEIFLLIGTDSVLDGDSINLGSVSTCSNGRDYSFSIKNIGTSALALSGTPIVDVSGIDPTYFTVVAQPSVSSIPVGGSVDFKIRFTPSGTNPRSAKISIPTDDADEANFSFNLNSTIGSPEIELSEFKVGGAVIPSGSAYYMGYSALNKKDTGAGFILKNLGDANLFLSGSPTLVLGGSPPYDFTYSNPSSTIAPGAQNNFYIQGFVSKLGLSSGAFSIENEDCDENPYTLNVSVTGYDYLKVTDSAAWIDRRGHSSVAFNNKLWVMGGVGYTNYKDVYSSSANGAVWTLVNANPPWGYRTYHSSLVFNNKMWIIGGSEKEQNTNIYYSRNDAWSSVDGVTWTKETDSAPWSGRKQFGAVVFDNKIWIMGGETNTSPTYANDVWYSSDGVNWTLATSNAGWPPRSLFAIFAFDNKLWVAGGWGGPGVEQLKDVWNSTDGVTWTKVTDTPVWYKRSAMAYVVYNNAMWILSGFDGYDTLYDSYRSTDGIKWTYVSPPWGSRDTHSAAVMNGKIWVMGGQYEPGKRFRDVVSFWDY
ncbi:choice-of-anchor D domain-containing protein [Leptospira sp. SA-E8]|uniref:choice-of-anchor D domain-containing protein n=1 Tax=Leptospira sp. SA-E8 TaxID=3422259 RepID=UPI003EB9811F